MGALNRGLGCSSNAASTQAQLRKVWEGLGKVSRCCWSAGPCPHSTASECEKWSWPCQPHSSARNSKMSTTSDTCRLASIAHCSGHCPQAPKRPFNCKGLVLPLTVIEHTQLLVVAQRQTIRYRRLRSLSALLFSCPSMLGILCSRYRSHRHGNIGRVVKQDALQALSSANATSLPCLAQRWPSGW